MKTFILIIHLMMGSNPDMVLPSPAEYIDVYCMYYDAEICDAVQEESVEPEAKARDLTA